MSIEKEIRDQIENIKKLKQEVGYINNHLSALEGMCREDKQKQVDDAYKRGLEDAWNVARKIAVETYDGGVSISALYEMFGTESMCMIMKNNTVYDVTDKLKAYEERKDDSIKVGDEMRQVTNSGAPTGVVCTVTAFDGERMSGFAQDGRLVVSSSQVNRWWKKTGRHHDIDPILEAMKNG